MHAGALLLKTLLSHTTETTPCLPKDYVDLNTVTSCQTTRSDMSSYTRPTLYRSLQRQEETRAHFGQRPKRPWLNLTGRREVLEYGSIVPRVAALYMNERDSKAHVARAPIVVVTRPPYGAEHCFLSPSIASDVCSTTPMPFLSSVVNFRSLPSTTGISPHIRP